MTIRSSLRYILNFCPFLSSLLVIKVQFLCLVYIFVFPIYYVSSALISTDYKIKIKIIYSNNYI